MATDVRDTIGQRTYRAAKHHIRLSYSDALPLSNPRLFGLAPSSTVSGYEISRSRSTGMISVGYRHQSEHFRVGGDIGFAHFSNNLNLKSRVRPSVKEQKQTLLVMPIGELTYMHKGKVRLYGSGGAGILFSRSEVSPLTEIDKKTILGFRSGIYADFAYQINPIGIEIGNEQFGGFLEAGVGHKGFCTTGFNLRF